jgi:hypothetical protein
VKASKPLLVSIIFLSISLITQTNANGKPVTLSNTYLDNNCGVSIQYPSNWQTLRAESISKLATSIVNLQPKSDDGSKVEVELLDLSDLFSKSFETVTSAEREYISQYVGKIETSTITKISSYPAQLLVYTEELPGVSADQWVKKNEVTIIAFDKEYKIIFDNDNSAKFDKYKSIFDQMVYTFKIYEPKFSGISCNPTSSVSQSSTVTNSSLNVQQALGPDYKIYRNMNYHVTAAYPNDWTYEETGHSNDSPETLFNVIFLSPLESGKPIQASLSISIDKLKPAKITLEQYKNRIVSNLNGVGHDVKDIIVSKDTLGTEPAYRITYMEWFLDHWEKSISIFVVKNGKLYGVDVLIEPESLNQYPQVVDNMVKTVQFQ